MEELLSSHNTLRLVWARALRTLIWTPPAALLVIWLPWKLSEYLFTHARFGLDLALTMAYGAAFFVPCVALALTELGRDAAVSRNGLLLRNRGFHILLRPERISSIQAGLVSLRRYALDPRYLVFGGDWGQWVIVRTKGGFTICLGLRDPQQFVEQARAYLGTWGQVM
jgi:hypothetical protein